MPQFTLRQCLVFVFALCVFLTAMGAMNHFSTDDLRFSITVSIAWIILCGVYVGWRCWGGLGVQILLSLCFFIFYLPMMALTLDTAADMYSWLCVAFWFSTLLSFPWAIGEIALRVLEKPT